MKSCFILVCLFSSYTTGLSVLPIRKNLPSLKHRSPAAIDPGPDPEPRAVDLYESYLKWIDRSPLIAKSVTAAVVGCLGDVLAQWLETKLATTTSSTIGLSFLSFNWVRFNAFFVSGLFFVGPFLHYWYDRLWALGHWLDNHITKNKNVQVLAQLVADQTLGVMLFFPLYFYAYELSEALVVLRVPSFSLATQKLMENLGSVFLMQYKVWPVVNFVNFKFVPERLRVLTSNVLSVFWNAYLCTRLA